MPAGLPDPPHRALLRSMLRPADVIPRAIPLLSALGWASLAAITLSSPGATRMHAWPWSVACVVALSVPAIILLLRLADRARPIVLPGRAWSAGALAGTLVILGSGLCSPYRGPSLIWSTPLLAAVAVFFVTFDWLHAAPAALEIRRQRLVHVAGGFFLLIAISSLGLWAVHVSGRGAAEIFDARNPYPLGHSNYTAGLALLMLPCFAALAWRARGRLRATWITAALLALGLLFTSASRGGLIGLAALIGGGLLAARTGWKKTFAAGLAMALAAFLLALAHPRTRAMFTAVETATAPNLSNVQRSAMFRAGLKMGEERPLLGWGPGTTPLAFPRFRSRLQGGAENVLQLHSLPFQLWAELGAAGILGLAAFLALAAVEARRQRAVAVTLGAYLVFAVTDYQLDVPVFAFSLAVIAALLAPPAAGADSNWRMALRLTMRTVLVGLWCFARPDPTPEMNVRALSLAPDPAHRTEAIELFDTSLRLNSDQEIAHFNLGWLLVVSDPAQAEQHFLAAARLVPDKGGVYFGLGLARLNQRRAAEAAQAFARECLNDPVFLVSPWWRDPRIGVTRAATLAEVRRLLAAANAGRPSAWTAAEIAYLRTLIPWLDGRDPASAELVARAHTPERAAYFFRRPVPPPFASAVVRAYHRERSGYPVLMRNLDLAVPLDVFAVEENFLATGEFQFLFPPKGWLPLAPE
ncbi:MAG: hypothetical protein JWM88_359 [Verrucomicrobia bacterium]|nr:hypothetical protein [Verrucomicrobiota bacterium]